MTMVWGDPAGFAVDWGWQRGLTVWELAGRRSEPRFHRKVLEYELPASPAGERQARAVARRWWRAQGHAQTIRAASGNETNAMFTNVEGEWDEVVAVIRACTDKVAEAAPG